MSPYLDDDSSYEVSPLFPTDDVAAPGHWPSLFPEEPNVDADISVDDIDAILGQTSEDHSTLDSSVSPSASPAIRSVGISANTARKGSVTGAGVRKRSNPLPPIVVEDPSDHVAVKRARNTLAARKSREKKVKKMEEMEAQIEDLKAQVEHWKRLCLARGRAA